MSPYEHDPTIAVVELCSIAKGIEVADRLLKEAYVRVLIARPVSPGKYLILFTGDVESVRSSVAVAIEVAGVSLLDQLFLPLVDPSVLASLSRPVEPAPLDAVGVVETSSVSSALEAADAAMKRGTIRLIETHLAIGIGGKSYFTFTGEVSDVEVALAVSVEVCGDRLLMKTLIPRPHADLLDVLSRHDSPIERTS